MKLRKMIVKNFRAIGGVESEICFGSSNIIFLIGQNNVGKSSFLKAYEFFINPKQKAAKEDFHKYDTNIPIEIEMWFTKEEQDDSDVALSGAGRNTEPDWITKWVDAEGIVKIKKVWEKEGDFKKQTFSPKDGQWQENGFGGFHTNLTKYAPTAVFINAIETVDSFEKKVNDLINNRFIKQIESNEEYEKIKKAVLDLQKEITGSSDITEFNREINEEFKKVFSNLTLQIKHKSDDGVDIKKAFEKNHSIGVKKDGVDRDENFHQHGHGVIRQALFNFLKFLAKLDESVSYIILFEEPEIFLHPKAAFNLRQSLYNIADNSSFQILCATHSPLMIDISKPNASLVRVVKNDDESTITYQANKDIFQDTDQKKQLVQMINRFNPHICEAFYANKVLLVEGDSETIIYRELLDRIYPIQDIFVLNTGSKNNIPFFQEILIHFHIEHYVIHDTDKPMTEEGNKNPAWSLNKTIWDNVEKANEVKAGLARRYVHVHDLESANDYTYDKASGKPLSAYRFAKSINVDSNVACLDWLKDILEEKKINHDHNYVLQEAGEDE